MAKSLPIGSLPEIEPGPDIGARASPSFLLVAAALLLLALVPLIVFKLPVMQDYPNHLARAYAIAFLDQDKLLAQYYDVHWQLIPDLALDGTVPWLARLVGVFAAGKLFVLAIVVLLPAGAVALYRALYRRFSLWPVASCLLVYNGIFALGFLNYLFAVGLALWGAACWVALREKAAPWRMGVSLLFGLALFFSHMLGLALYGLAIGSYELWRWFDERPSPARLARDVAALALPFLALAPLVLASPTAGDIALTEWWFWPEKPRGILMVFRGYDKSAGFVFLAAAAVFLSWGLWSRRLRIHPAGIVFTVTAAIFYLAIPSTLAGVEFVDLRLPVAFAFVLLGMSNWTWRSAGEARGLVGALVAVMCLIILDVGTHWARDATTIAGIEASFTAIPAGGRVLEAVDTERNEVRRLFHVPALVMIERSALYSHAFTDPGKQPLAVKAPYQSATSRNGQFLKLTDLVAADRAPDKAAGDYWADWRKNYDYLYVMFDGESAGPPLPDLQPIAQGRDFALYRIIRHHIG